MNARRSFLGGLFGSVAALLGFRPAVASVATPLIPAVAMAEQSTAVRPLIEIENALSETREWINPQHVVSISQRSSECFSVHLLDGEYITIGADKAETLIRKLSQVL
jgi:hypothetical protein